MIEQEQAELIATLQHRFECNQPRHKDVEWKSVEQQLLQNPNKLSVLQKMEESGGEPDVVRFALSNSPFAPSDIVFVDCSEQSPEGRRSLCYDKAAWNSRKKDKPATSAWEMAEQIGIKILNEEQYLYLQTLGDFDTKTQSWLDTPESIRKLGGAIWGDKSYGRTFICYNGVESYYRVRGFRGYVVIN